MQSVMVTGAAGFIGSRIVEKLSNTGNNIVAIDSLIDGNYSSKIKSIRWSHLKERCPEVNFVNLDLRNRDLVLELPKVDVLINEAAIPGLLHSFKDFDLYSSCNINATNNLIDYANNNQVTRFIHASTSSVYGEYAVGNEDMPTNPCSPYGITKLAAELLIRNKLDCSKSQFAILRYFSIYGPSQRPDMAFAKFIEALNNNRPIDITGDLNSVRSNTYIDDAVDATISFIDLDLSAFGNVYNVCGDEEISLAQAIEWIGFYLNKQVDFTRSKARPGDQKVTKGDNSKIKSLGLLSQTVKFEIGIRNQVERHILEASEIT